MFLEKIKQHGGKISFFVINLLLIAVGAQYLKQKALEDAVRKAIADNLVDSANSAQAGDALQQQITDDASAKNASIKDNTGTVTRQKNTTVTKTIPAVTQTVTTTQPANSGSVSSSSSKSSSTPKATTKKS